MMTGGLRVVMMVFEDSVAPHASVSPTMIAIMVNLLKALVN